MYNSKDRITLFQILRDMEDFAEFKQIPYSPIYLLGGSGCIIAGYLDRATTDLDLIDMEYEASMGRILRLLDKFDLLDLYLTTIPMDFTDRAIKINEFQNIYVLAKEDIILSKIGRYSQIDIEDISKLMIGVNKNFLLQLINFVIVRENLSLRVKDEFIKNLALFREKFDV